RLRVQATDILFERSTFCGIKAVIRPPSRSRASPKPCPTVLSGLRGLPEPARSDPGMVGVFFVWRRALRGQRHERRTLQAELEWFPVNLPYHARSAMWTHPHLACRHPELSATTLPSGCEID